MPRPVSVQRNATRSPTGSRQTETRPPSGVYFTALPTMLTIMRASSSRSPIATRPVAASAPPAPWPDRPTPAPCGVTTSTRMPLRWACTETASTTSLSSGANGTGLATSSRCGSLTLASISRSSVRFTSRVTLRSIASMPRPPSPCSASSST